MATQTVVLSLSEESLAHLNELASFRKVSIDVLAQQAVENMLAWETETLEAYNEGVREVDRGEFYTNEEVRAMLDSFMQKRTAA